MIFNNKGLTLIETMVSGIIGAIIAGIILSIFTMQGSALNEGTANAKMLRQANGVTDRIAQNVRRAHSVFATDETWAKTPAGFSAKDAAAVLLYDTAGTVIGGYQVSGTDLDTTSDGSSWPEMYIAGEKIQVESGSNFTLTADRKALQSNLTIEVQYRGKSYSMPLNGSTYSCRN